MTRLRLHPQAEEEEERRRRRSPATGGRLASHQRRLQPQAAAAAASLSVSRGRWLGLCSFTDWIGYWYSLARGAPNLGCCAPLWGSEHGPASRDSRHAQASAAYTMQLQLHCVLRKWGSRRCDGLTKLHFDRFEKLNMYQTYSKNISHLPAIFSK